MTLGVYNFVQILTEPYVTGNIVLKVFDVERKRVYMVHDLFISYISHERGQ